MRKRLLTLACTLAAAGAAHGQTSPAAPTKSNGDFITGTGNFSNGFLTDSGGGVSVYLKARGRAATAFPGQPVSQSGNVFVVLSGFDGSGVRSWWNWDFQFTPRPTDTIGGVNYTLKLEFDTDPSAGTSFIETTRPMFDADSDGTNSWEDGDGFFVNPGSGAWSDDTIPYVYSQSWRYEFSEYPPAPSIPAGSLGPGDYTIRWSAMDPAGNTLASVEAIARVIDASQPSLSLEPEDSCLNASEGDQIVVDVNVANAGVYVIGGEFFLTYDTSKLSFVSATPGDAPFDQEMFESVDTIGGTIDYSSYVDFINLVPGTDEPTTMARLTFDVIGELCDEDALVSWRSHVPPTRITPSGGADIQPATTDLSAITNDNTAPDVFVPADISVNADAGYCTALVLPGVATASDDCDSAPTVVGARSDFLDLTDPYPTGPTTITWTATDACGNAASDTQTVTVNALNELDVVVELDSVGGGISVDGSLADWAGVTSHGVTTSGSDSVEVYSTWGPDGLYLAFDSSDTTDGRVLDQDDALSVKIGLAGNAMSLPWDQGFEADTSGWLDEDDSWSGQVTMVPSGTNGIPAASGAEYAIFEQTNASGGETGPFSRFDMYRDTWPGGMDARIKIYLDPSAMVPGEGFQYSVAANGSDNAHQRDYVFHVVQDVSTGSMLLNADNNAYPAGPRQDIETTPNYLVVPGAGWYTFEHHFRDDAGVLAVDMNVYDASGSLVYTETRSDPGDLIPSEIGGNRYAWFYAIDVAGGIAVDDHSLQVSTGADWRYCWDVTSDGAFGLGPVGDAESGTPGDFYGVWRSGDDSVEANSATGEPGSLAGVAPASTGIVQATGFGSGTRVTELFIPYSELFDGVNGWTLANRPLVRFMGAWADAPAPSFSYPDGADTGDQGTYQGVLGTGLDRCIAFELREVGSGTIVMAEHTLAFLGGVAAETVTVPCGDYECIDARDTLHTLRRTDSDDFTTVGTRYSADFSSFSSGGDDDALLGGNFNDDDFIDILDFGVFVSQYQTDPNLPGGDTPCGTGVDADASGNGNVGTEDFTFIQTQFLFAAEVGCDMGALMATAPERSEAKPTRTRIADGTMAISRTGRKQGLDAITLDDLKARGLGSLGVADIDRNGVLNQADAAAFLAGDRPDAFADLNSDGRIDHEDLRRVIEGVRGEARPVDPNADGRCDDADIYFVMKRLGTHLSPQTR